MKTKFLLLAVVMLLLSCHPKPKEDQYPVMCDLAAPAEYNAPPNEMVKFSPPFIKDDAVEENKTALPAEPQSQEKALAKKIIKDGSLSIKVEDLNASKHYIDGVLKKFDAYYEQEDFTNYEKVSRFNLKIRVPSKQFEKFLAAAEKGDGEIASKNINVRDVTEEYTDTEIRLSTKQLFRKRYYELLSKAAKIEDVLSIEENIRTLQEDIESFEGRLKLMNDQITYSTLDLSLFTEKEEAVKEETFVQKVRSSLKTGWASVITFVLWSIQQWPWLVIAIVLLLMIRRWWKKLKRNS